MTQSFIDSIEKAILHYTKDIAQQSSPVQIRQPIYRMSNPELDTFLESLTCGEQVETCILGN